MKTTRVIAVRQEHIARGCAGDPYRCMVSLAAVEQIPGAVQVCSAGTIEVYDSKSARTPVEIGNVPDAVLDRIRDYDEGRPVEPFTFDVEMGVTE